MEPMVTPRLSSRNSIRITWLRRGVLVDCTWSRAPSHWSTLGEGVGLLMSAGFLHSNGNCPDSLTLFFSSSDRPRSDRPVPKALLACSTAARYQSLAPSHCPAAPRLHFPSTASSTRIHSQPATHPRTHAPTRSSFSKHVKFIPRLRSQHRLIITSVSAASCFCFSTRPRSRTRTRRRSWTLARP